jgi:hypothetical protein
MGKLITELKDDPGVFAITAGRVMGQQRDSVAVPCVIVVDLGSSKVSSESGVRRYSYGARCYGPNAATGDITAKQLANAVVGAVGSRGPRRHAAVGIYRSTEVSSGPVLLDPDTREPYVIVSLELAVAAGAVT